MHIQLYKAGDQLVLGGPGLASILDSHYLLAFRLEDALFHHAAAAGPQADTAAASGCVPQQQEPWLPSLCTASIPVLVAPRNLDFKTWRALLVRVVKQDRLADVRTMIETGECCGWGAGEGADAGTVIEAGHPLVGLVMQHEGGNDLDDARALMETWKVGLTWQGAPR